MEQRRSRRDNSKSWGGKAQRAFSVRKHRPDYRVVLYMGLLMLLGLIVIYAIGPQRAQVLNYAFGTENYNGTYFFIRQALSLLVAIAGFVVVAKFPYRILLERAGLLLIIGLVACLVLAIAAALHLPFAPVILGAARWFDLGPFGSMQPAEFLKFAVLLFVAGFLGARYREGKINDRDATLLPMGILLAVVTLFIVVLQKNMSTGVVLAVIVLSMLFVAGLNRRIIAMICAGVLVLGIGFIMAEPHRRARVSTFLQGDSVVEDNASRHINQAKIAIGSGGLTGLGIGNSVQATGYLPEAINDSVFAIMGEIFGFVGLVAITALFTALLLRLLHIGDHLPDMSTKLIVVGIFSWLTAHTVINIAAMLGLFPLTGITLPLVSFGGTSMLFIAGALGLVFQLSHYTVNDVSVEGGGDESSRSRRGVRRSRYASSRRYQ